MTDWVYAHLDEKNKEDLGVAALSELNALLLQSSPCIKLCREVATAGKHFRIDQKPNPGIMTIAATRQGNQNDADSEA
ncbi:MAG: hypothetical protein WC284_03890 [Candidimonas sp.]|jgi:hypothetical protein